MARTLHWSQDAPKGQPRQLAQVIVVPLGLPALPRWPPDGAALPLELAGLTASNPTKIN